MNFMIEYMASIIHS